MNEPSKPRSDVFQYNSETETGWDRIKIMFSRDQDGLQSKELMFAWNGVVCGFISGGIIGAIEAFKPAKQDFLRKNQESIYNHEYHAQRHYKDHMIREMMRHGWKWGWRVSLLVGSFMTICTTFSVYRNKVAVQDFTFAGVISGSIWRMNRGIRPMFASGILGGILGTGAGGLIFTLLWATGNSVAEMRYWGHHQYISDLQKRQAELIAKYKREKEADTEENRKLMIWHDKKNEEHESSSSSSQ